MATPDNVPMSMTRGVSFLPGKMTAEQQADARREAAERRWTRTEDRDDTYRRKIRKGSK